MCDACCRHITCVGASSSFEKMRAFRDTYLSESDRDTLRVLDVGSMGNRASSYRALFAPPAFEYVGLDLADGPNVDIVPPDPYRWDSLGRESFDLVISGQAFEHNPYFWITAAEIARVLVEGGLTAIIAPSRGPVHRHPFDCWRFYPDSWSVLCQYVGLELLESSVDNGSWRKMVPGTMAWRESFMVRASLASSTKRQEMPSTKVLTQSHGPAGHFRRRRSSTRWWGRRSGATNRSTRSQSVRRFGCSPNAYWLELSFGSGPGTQGSVAICMPTVSDSPRGEGSRRPPGQ